MIGPGPETGSEKMTFRTVARTWPWRFKKLTPIESCRDHMAAIPVAGSGGRSIAGARGFGVEVGPESDAAVGKDRDPLGLTDAEPDVQDTAASAKVIASVVRTRP